MKPSTIFRRIDPIPAELLASPLAASIPSAELRSIERRGTTVSLAAGREITREAEIGRECVIVVTGSFAVERDGVEVAVIKPGAVVGEIALLTNQPRNATVTAREDSLVYAFNRAEFFSLLDACPKLATMIYSEAVQRSLAG